MNIEFGKRKGAAEMIFGVSAFVLLFLGLLWFVLQPYMLFGVPVFYLLLGIASIPVIGVTLVKLLGVKG